MKKQGKVSSFLTGKPTRILLFLLLLLLPLSFFGVHAARPKIAVLPFEDGSLKKWWSGDFKPGEGIADSFVTELVKSKAFTVIEREQLKKVLEEQGLGGTGIIDAATAAKVGRAMGVRYLITGKVTEFSIVESGVGIGALLNLFGSNNSSLNSLDTKTRKAKVAIDARLINTDTAAIEFAEKGVGEETASNVSMSGQNFGMTEFRESILGKATDKAIMSLLRKFVDAVRAEPEGKVVDVEQGIVTVNMGEGEITAGQRLIIFSKGKEIRDPDTKELLDVELNEIGLMQINLVSKRISKGAVLEKTGNPKPGDIVKLAKAGPAEPQSQPPPKGPEKVPAAAPSPAAESLPAAAKQEEGVPGKIKNEYDAIMADSAKPLADRKKALEKILKDVPQGDECEKLREDIRKDIEYLENQVIWADWLNRFRKNVSSVESDKNLSPEARKKAYEELLAQYSDDDPHTEDDEKLKEDIKGKIELLGNQSIWSNWLRSFKAEFSTLKAKKALPSSERKKAMEALLKKYGDDDPYTDEDEKLRAEIQNNLGPMTQKSGDLQALQQAESRKKEIEKKQQEESLKKEAEKQRLEEAGKKELERKQQLEEVHKKELEIKQQQAEARKAELEKKQQEESLKKEAEKQRLEEARKKELEIKQQQAEARKEELEKKQQEEALRKEAEKQRLEEARKKKLERKQQLEEVRKKELERKQQEEALRKEAEKQRLEEARNKELERKQQLEEVRKKELERKQQEEALRKEAEKQRLEEARKKELERKQQLEEVRKKELERKQQEEALRKESEKQRLEEARKKELELKSFKIAFQSLNVDAKLSLPDRKAAYEDLLKRYKENLPNIVEVDKIRETVRKKIKDLEIPCARYQKLQAFKEEYANLEADSRLTPPEKQKAFKDLLKKCQENGSSTDEDKKFKGSIETKIRELEPQCTWFVRTHKFEEAAAAATTTGANAPIEERIKALESLQSEFSSDDPYTNRDDELRETIRKQIGECRKFLPFYQELSDLDKETAALSSKRDLTQILSRYDGLLKKSLNCEGDAAEKGKLCDNIRKKAELVRSSLNTTSLAATNEKDGTRLIRIPAGNFKMGSTPQEIEDVIREREKAGKTSERKKYESEMPQHTVHLDEYEIGLTEVTNLQFERFVNETNYKTEAEIEGWGYVYEKTFDGKTKLAQKTGVSWRSFYGPATGNHPVIVVSWNDADAYCQWAGLRLPTEAEWEKAARGASGEIYPWGTDWAEGRCNFFKTEAAGKVNLFEGGGTMPVGLFPSGESPYGVLDMAGNVAEWCADWYEESYDGSPATNPRGPASGSYRVLRGGSWVSTSPDSFRCAARTSYLPNLRYFFAGFRCARNVQKTY